MAVASREWRLELPERLRSGSVLSRSARQLDFRTSGSMDPTKEFRCETLPHSDKVSVLRLPAQHLRRFVRQVCCIAQRHSAGLLK